MSRLFICADYKPASRAHRADLLPTRYQRRDSDLEARVRLARRRLHDAGQLPEWVRYKEDEDASS
jgi:hypothetical protein